MSQIEIEFPRGCPIGFLSLREYAIYVQQQASISRTGTHTERLDNNVIIEYIDVLPSLILKREDRKDWHPRSVSEYGLAFFGGRPVRKIELQTASGYKSERGTVEITPRFGSLRNFRVSR